MIEDVIAGMQKPHRLMDFLNASFELGGVISILSLNGIFVLITKYNLYVLLLHQLTDYSDFPEFYSRLYSLFEPSLFYTKYRNRFWKLALVFLCSAYLPAYLVAAFIKKIARLMLGAPPGGCISAMIFIWNLLQRHPECRILIHRPQKEDKRLLLLGVTNVEETAPLEECQGYDPYDMKEKDPLKAKAMDSCLWELTVRVDRTCCCNCCAGYGESLLS